RVSHRPARMGSLPRCEIPIEIRRNHRSSPMRLHTAEWTRNLAALVFMALAVLAGRPAQAQVNPLWDHYKAYLANPKPQHLEQLTLVDQFETRTDEVTQYLDFFANPVDKIHGTTEYRINNPDLHYAWWVLSQRPFTKDVIASNQFGDQLIHV